MRASEEVGAFGSSVAIIVIDIEIVVYASVYQLPLQLDTNIETGYIAKQAGNSCAKVNGIDELDL